MSSDWYDALPSRKQDRLAELLKDERGRSAREYAGDDTPFGCWLLVADVTTIRNHHLSIFDLPDRTWRDFYDEGLTPAQAVTVVLEEEGMAE